MTNKLLKQKEPSKPLLIGGICILVFVCISLIGVISIYNQIKDFIKNTASTVATVTQISNYYDGSTTERYVYVSFYDLDENPHYNVRLCRDDGTYYKDQVIFIIYKIENPTKIIEDSNYFDDIVSRLTFDIPALIVAIVLLVTYFNRKRLKTKLLESGYRVYGEVYDIGYNVSGAPLLLVCRVIILILP